MGPYCKIILLVTFIVLGSAQQFEARAIDGKTGKDSTIKSNKTRKEKRLQRKAMVIAFDETGQMIQFPKQVVKRNQVVVFKVRVSRSNFASHINKLFTRLDSVYEFFNRPENRFVLWTLFKNDVNELEAWTQELRSYLSIRQELSNGKEYDLWRYDPANESRIDNFINPLVYMPIREYINNLLFEQFKIKTYDLSYSINSEIQLKPDFRNKKPDKNDCYWWYSEPILMDALLGTDCSGCGNNLKFSLITQDVWKETVVSWYNKQFAKVDKTLTPFLQKPGKSVLKEKLEYLLKANDQLVKLDGADESQINAILKLLSDFSEQFDDDGEPVDSIKGAQLDTSGIRFMSFQQPQESKQPGFDMQEYLATIRLVRPWLFYWLWYNNGFLVVNPLPVVGGPSSDAKKAALKSAAKLLQRYQQQKNFLDSVRVNIADTITNFQVFKNVQDSTDTVSHLIDSINNVIESLNKSIRQDSIARVKAEDLTKQIGITGLQSYVGQLPIYKYKRWYQERALLLENLTIQKQFSYSAHQRSINAVYRNQRQKIISTEIPENERAMLVIHNIPKNSKVSITQTLTGFNDMEEFTVLFQKLMKGLDSTGLFQLALPPGLSGFSNFLQNTANRTSMSSAQTAAAKEAGKALSKPASVDAMTFTYLQTSAQRSPAVYDPNMMVVVSISKKIDTSGGYLTKIYPTVDSTAPYQVNITLAIDSVKAKSVIKVGALHRFQMAAGFAVVSNPVDQFLIDTVGSGFRTSSSSNNSSVIAGFKIYPFKTYLRDGGFIPRYPLRRLSAVIAFSIPKPLNNFYFGGGYDLVPGLAFTVGVNVYKQNYYSVENARITKSATRYAKGGTYYGVTVNPVILVQFVKLFFN